MNLSVIICTWNNSKRLLITLDSLSKCIVPDGTTWELVIVNNNCTDNTDNIVNKYKVELPIIYVKEPIQGLSRAKNAGLRVARGQLIIFTDDDVTPCPEWITTYWAAYQKNPTGYFWGGPVTSKFENPNVDKDLIDAVGDYAIKGFDSGEGAGEPADPKIRFISANWACPTEILRQLGGFDTDLGLNPASNRVRLGEETDLMNKLMENGWKRWYLPGARVLHFVPAHKCDLKYITARAKAYGRGNIRDFSFKKDRPRILGAPPLIYKILLMKGLSLVTSRLQGKKAYKKYLAWFYYLGIWEGFFLKYKQQK